MPDKCPSPPRVAAQPSHIEQSTEAHQLNPGQGHCASHRIEEGLRAAVHRSFWCISKSQLWRYIHLVAEYGAAALEKDKDRACGSGRRAEGIRSHKRDYVVTWFMNYAEETTERLPDVDVISLPRMS